LSQRGVYQRLWELQQQEEKVQAVV
jgi:hypothetical protein